MCQLPKARPSSLQWQDPLPYLYPPPRPPPHPPSYPCPPPCSLPYPYSPPLPTTLPGPGYLQATTGCTSGTAPGWSGCCAAATGGLSTRFSSRHPSSSGARAAGAIKVGTRVHQVPEQRGLSDQASEFIRCAVEGRAAQGGLSLSMQSLSIPFLMNVLQAHVQRSSFFGSFQSPLCCCNGPPYSS